jgi:hypothetical protein
VGCKPSGRCCGADPSSARLVCANQPRHRGGIYLDRLATAQLLTAQPTTAGPGFRRLRLASGTLPKSLGGGLQAHIATSGEALRLAAEHIEVAGTVTLGPGEQAFTDLIVAADTELAQDMYRSGAAEDPTSLTPYDLYAYEAHMSESDGRRNSVWATLVKVDDSGDARAVRWETLENLVPTAQPGTWPHPARSDAADGAARRVAQDTVNEHREVRAQWFASARRELDRLPVNLTADIKTAQPALACVVALPSKPRSDSALLRAYRT